MGLFKWDVARPMVDAFFYPQIWFVQKEHQKL